MTKMQEIASSGVQAQADIDRHLDKAYKAALRNIEVTENGVEAGMVRAIKGKAMIAKARKIAGMIEGASNHDLKKFVLAQCYDSLAGHEEAVRPTQSMYATETVYRGARGESRICNFIPALAAMHQARLKG